MPKIIKQNRHIAEDIISENVPIVETGMSIGDVVKKVIDSKVKSLQSLDYVYVLKEGKLIGVISIKELFSHDRNMRIEKIMKNTLIKAHSHTKQEKIAYMALKNGLKSIPVVSKEGTFIGAICNDAILKIMHREKIEDLLHISGIHNKQAVEHDVLKTSLFQIVKHRFPWLIIGLIGGLAAAQIVTFFEHKLAENLILAAFIPLIVYMADAVGTQMEVYIIRDIAFDANLPFKKVFLSSATFGDNIIGFLMSLFLLIAGYFLYNNVSIALVLSIALFSTILSSVITGLVIPYLFNKFSFDPANASGPIATIIQDILSITIYFSVAAMLL